MAVSNLQDLITILAQSVTLISVPNYYAFTRNKTLLLPLNYFIPDSRAPGRLYGPVFARQYSFCVGNSTISSSEYYLHTARNELYYSTKSKTAGHLSYTWDLYQHPSIPQQMKIHWKLYVIGRTLLEHAHKCSSF